MKIQIQIITKIIKLKNKNPEPEPKPDPKRNRNKIKIEKEKETSQEPTVDNQKEPEKGANHNG